MQLTWDQTASFAKAASSAMTSARYKGKVGPRMLARVLMAIADVESTRYVNAKNPSSTAAGPLQILSGTRQWLEQRLGWPTTSQQHLMLQPYYSFLLAAEYLCYLHLRPSTQKKWSRTVIAYNQGHYNTTAAGRQYLRKVVDTYRSNNISTMA